MVQRVLEAFFIGGCKELCGGFGISASVRVSRFGFRVSGFRVFGFRVLRLQGFGLKASAFYFRLRDVVLGLSYGSSYPSSRLLTTNHILCNTATHPKP